MASTVGGYSSSSATTNSPGSCDACRRNCRPPWRVSPESNASDFTSAACCRATSDGMTYAEPPRSCHADDIALDAWLRNQVLPCCVDVARPHLTYLCPL